MARQRLGNNGLAAGEWGGKFTDVDGIPDATWHRAFATYLQQLGATDTFYWCINPTSSDTGGILQSDWMTPVQQKMSLLAQLVPSPGRVVINNGLPTAISPGNGQATYSLSGERVSDSRSLGFLLKRTQTASGDAFEAGALVPQLACLPLKLLDAKVFLTVALGD